MKNSGWDHSMYLALFSRSIVALLLASMNSSVISLKISIQIFCREKIT